MKTAREDGNEEIQFRGHHSPSPSLLVCCGHSDAGPARSLRRAKTASAGQPAAAGDVASGRADDNVHYDAELSAGDVIPAKHSHICQATSRSSSAVRFG